MPSMKFQFNLTYGLERDVSSRSGCKFQFNLTDDSKRRHLKNFKMVAMHLVIQSSERVHIRALVPMRVYLKSASNNLKCPLHSFPRIIDTLAVQGFMGTNGNSFLLS